MLNTIKIRNLALVDELLWELGAGLVGVTGETGAGKSVIVGALKLVLGGRADKSLIRTGEDTCMIEAVFSVPAGNEMEEIAKENMLDFQSGDDLIIRRVIGQAASKQFVNDSPVTLNLLKKIGEHLVDLHGPHEHQSLLSVERQLTMLDAYAGNHDLLSLCRNQFQEWRKKVLEHEAVLNAEAMSVRELELLKHQLDEIDRANFRADEETELVNRYHRASGSAKLLETTSHALSVLSGREDSIMAQISELRRSAREMEKLDPSLLEKFSSLETASVELQELEDTLTDYLDELEINPEEAAALEERVNLLESLKRKYGASIAEILAHREQVATRLDQVENRSEKLQTLHEEIKTLRAKLDASAHKLTTARKKSAPKLAKEISAQLKDLGFKQAAFEILLETLAEPSATGNESIDFLIGPNPGEPLQPLRQIGSSGEISRVMLAVKSALADQDATPLMVFDEIDANVGGEIAKSVGKKMAALGAKHQVIAITHFPQVAAIAQSHYVVEKEVSGGRTRSRLRPVTGDARVQELVRMLGGGGASAEQMAKELLKGA